jgi:hypothetical protein
VYSLYIPARNWVTRDAQKLSFGHPGSSNVLLGYYTLALAI